MASNLSRTQQLDRTSAPRMARRLLAAVALAAIAATLGACDSTGKTIGDYLNLRNSLLDPSQVGRFDKDNPYGTVRPVKWPILDQLDLIDQPADQWAAATDPTPADLVPDRREFTVAPGDAVHITIFGLLQPEQEFARDMVVSQSGSITLPYLGTVDISGMTASQAQEKLKQVAIAKRVLPEEGNGNPGPQISVMITQSQARTYSVIGMVQHAGVYSLYSADLRLLMALSQVGDIAGGTQPGLDYIYVIRTSQEQFTTQPGQAPGAQPASNGAATTPAPNPLEAIESIEKNAAPETKPAPIPVPGNAPGTMPAGPGSTGPTLLRPLPAAVSMSDNGTSRALAQADLDAALNPGAAATTAPMPKPAATQPAEDLLNQAVTPPTTTRPGQYVWIDGKWVLIPGAATQPAAVAQPAPAPGVAPAVAPPPGAPAPAVAGPAPTTPPADVYSAVENMTTQRVIRIPINQLRAGDPRYNIIIRPGDVINVPSIEQGEFYMMGHINRPGVYGINGRKLTLKQAVAAAGGLDSLAIPRRCELIRRIGANQEAIVQVNLQSIFDGEQADIFLKPYDQINVGTDLFAPFLAVTRNAYRLSYGFGFVYDRNFYIQPNNP